MRKAVAVPHCPANCCLFKPSVYDLPPRSGPLLPDFRTLQLVPGLGPAKATRVLDACGSTDKIATPPGVDIEL